MATSRTVAAKLLHREQRSLPDALALAEEDLRELIDAINCAPILLRLAWHDAGTYDSSVPLTKWPRCGGANGSIHYFNELYHDANSGLALGVAILADIKTQYAEIGWADFIQLAGAAAVECTGGPKIDMRYGRKTVDSHKECPLEGSLPEAHGPFKDGSTNAAGHVRKVFRRMGLSDKDAVALSGAHTIGRAFKSRSGAGADSSKYTTGFVCPRRDGRAGFGVPGGSAWTDNWLTFDNRFFENIESETTDPELLKLDTDKALFSDPAFREHAMRYKDDQAAFFADYAAAHKRLSELGAVFEPPEGVKIEYR